VKEEEKTIFKLIPPGVVMIVGDTRSFKEEPAPGGGSGITMVDP
jgi:hypothetical protein